MSRKPPAGLPPAVQPAPRPGTVTETRDYELITPLFGGGAAPREADPVTVVRGTAIRGQLRFWWRACRGARYGGDLARLRAAEDLLWGAPSRPDNPRPSRVQLALTVTHKGRDDRPFEVVAGTAGRTGEPRAKIQVRPGTVGVPYAAFPLQPSEQEARDGGIGMPTPALRVGVQFTLTLSYPSAWQDATEAACFGGSPADEVVAALWAWETFGGIGARTRRGFGALWRAGAGPPSPREAAVWLKAGLEKHVLEGEWPADLPHLARKGVLPIDRGRPPAPLPPGVRFLVLGPWPSALDAWKHLINKLKDFRQARGARAFGASQWPEPEAIRRLLAPPRVHSPNPLQKFPRAAFGLPIIFHFKDQQLGDPKDSTLLGKDRAGNTLDRLASPLILRPLACANGQAAGLAVILRAPSAPPGGLILREKESKQVHVIPVEKLTPEEAQAIPPLNGQVDVLQAFLNMLARA
ncbi:MAG TPA: type III-B CRISPR module RAMP protein Cmr1 [Chloroflexia bacterium]|nr:type III-B CRISPR module RAMP protein Cmr1 [Chloroflexia bacterium]